MRFLIATRFLLKLMSVKKGILYFYFLSIFLAIISYLTEDEYIFITLLTLSSIYLFLLYECDSHVYIFYKVHFVDLILIHISKTIIIYLASLLQLGFYFIIIQDISAEAFLIHFSSFCIFAMIITSNSLIKFTLMILAFAIIPVFANFTSIYFVSILICSLTFLFLYYEYTYRKVYY